MKTIRRPSRQFEFCFPERDTFVLVEESEDGVLIRATRDTFSSQRRASFLRELQAEGFISEACNPTGYSTRESRHFITWIIDHTWVKPRLAEIAKTNRFMIRLLMGGLLFWVGLLGALFNSGLK